MVSRLKQNLKKRLHEWPTTYGGTSINIPGPHQATKADYELWDELIEVKKLNLHPLEKACVDESYSLIPDWYRKRHKLT